MPTLIKTALQTDAGRIVMNYAVGVALLDAVRISAPMTVDKAQAGPLASSGEAIGFVGELNFPAAGQCQLVTHGPLDGFVGLVVGARYALSRALGQIVRVDDTANPNYPVAGEFLQPVGWALTTTKMFVNVTPYLLAI